MPATKERKNPFENSAIGGGSVTLGQSSVPSSPRPHQSVWKRTGSAAGVIDSMKIEGESGDDGDKEGEMFSSIKSRMQLFEDRTAMPPPPTNEVPSSRLAKITHGAKSSSGVPSEITLDQAKDILLGKSSSGQQRSSNSSGSKSGYSNNSDTVKCLQQQTQTSTSSVYVSAPWRSVYSGTSTTTTSTSSSSTVTDSLGGITPSTSDSQLSTYSSPGRRMPGDIDEMVPVKDESGPPRPRSRVEVTNIHLGSASSQVWG